MGVMSARESIISRGRAESISDLIDDLIKSDEKLLKYWNKHITSMDKEKLLRELYQACDEEILISDNQKTQVSIAVGSAVYDSRIDNGFMDVFNRADSAMYENKRKIKKL